MSCERRVFRFVYLVVMEFGAGMRTSTGDGVSRNLLFLFCFFALSGKRRSIHGVC